MHSIRNYFILLLVFLCSSSLLIAQTTPCTPPPAPDFVPNAFTQCSGVPFTFEITVPKTDERYVWDFGDNKTLTTNSGTVSHTYVETGTGSRTFDVKVYSVNTLTSCISPVTTKTITVNRQVAFNTPTVTNNVGTGSNVCFPDSTQNISVTATLTNPNASAAGISSYQVNWGNGETKTYTPAEFSGAATISNPTPYNKEGVFPITVTAVSSDPNNACSATVKIPFNVGRDPKAVFSVEKKERINPQIACGVPVRVEIKNESTGGGLSYKWEVTNSEPGGSTNFTFIESTSDTSANPVLQFNEKGQYSIKLSVKNPCVTANDTIGPTIPFDPQNPDKEFDEDGKYVQEESVLIVYPQVQIQSFQQCEELVAGQPLTIMGSELGRFDANLGTIQPSTILWVVTGGATIDNPNIENPKITFPGPGTYTVAATFANECERSQDAPGANQRPPATIVITARPPKPADGSVTLCGGESYEIKPARTGTTTFNFYTTPTGGTPVARDTTAYLVNPVTNTTTYYIAAVLNGCESRERGAFTINVLPPIQNNEIQTPQSICAGATPVPLVGTQPTGANGNFSYTWISSTTSATSGFNTAAGVNNGSGYAPAALAQTTWFRRLVRSTSCKPDTSAAVEITVVPVIATNTITQDQTVCVGTPAATLIGTRPTGGNGIDYAIIWESSTTSATAGFAPATGANGSPVIINEENLEPGAISQTTWYRRQVTSVGCSGYSNVIQITVSPGLSQNTIGASQTLCANATPAALTGSVPTGGTGTYNYLWESSTSNDATSFSPAAGTNNGQTYNPGALTQTTYFRRKVTSGSCEPSISEVVTISVTPAIENNTITAAQTVVCEGTVPVLTGSTPTGSGSLVYLWESSVTSASAGFNPAIGTNNAKDYTPGSVVQNTWYRRTVSTTGANCPPVISNVVAVTIDKLPAAPTVEAADVRACAGASATLRVTSTGGTYQWFTTATGGTPVSFEPVFVTPVLTTDITYYVQATNSNQCVSVTRTPVKVTVTAITADAGRDTTIIEGQPFGLRATGGTTYVWSPATGLNNPNVATPVAMPTKTTTYQVTVTTEDGCTATDEITITVIPRVQPVNTFSPNGDNINETWEIKNIENYPNATVEVFNRWGNPVFKSDAGYRQPWDGTHKGSALPLATYYYIIRLDRDSKPISGSITIIR